MVQIRKQSLSAHSRHHLVMHILAEYCNTVNFILPSLKNYFCYRAKLPFMNRREVWAWLTASLHYMRRVCVVEVKNRSHTPRMKALAEGSLRRSFLRHLRNRLRKGVTERWKMKMGKRGIRFIAPSCSCSHLISTFPVGVRMYQFSPSLPSPISVQK